MMRAVLLVLCAALLLGACIPPAPPSGWPTIDNPAAIHTHPFFVCTREHETPGNRVWPYEDGYTYDTGNGYFGAYQFAHSTWVGVVQRMQGGIWASWAAVTANVAPVDVQDRAALQLANERGAQPWGGRCREHLYR